VVFIRAVQCNAPTSAGKCGGKLVDVSWLVELLVFSSVHSSSYVIDSFNTSYTSDRTTSNHTTKCRPNWTLPYWSAVDCRPPDRPAPGGLPARPPSALQTTTTDDDRRRQPSLLVSSATLCVGGPVINECLLKMSTKQQNAKKINACLCMTLEEITSILPRDANLVRHMWESCVRLSVYLYVTSRYSVKTAKRNITQTKPKTEERFYFSEAKWRNSKSSPFRVRKLES